MTTPLELGPAGERAAAELTKRLRAIVPASLLADPDGFSRRFMLDAIADGWRWRPSITPPAAAKRGSSAPAEAHADELAAARARCEEAARALREAEGRTALERTDDHA